MTVKEIMNTDLTTLYNLPEKELRAVVQTLSSAANKRIVNIKAQPGGINAPAVKAAGARSFRTSAGGEFGTRGKSYNQLRNELKALHSFYQKKTSSVAGWKKLNKQVQERIGAELSGDSMANFWKLYREAEQGNKFVSGWDSVGVQRSIAQKIGKGMSSDDILNAVQAELNSAYEDTENDDDEFDELFDAEDDL